MRILYVHRGNPPASFVRRHYRALLQSSAFQDQEGFFESALYAVADVTSIPITALATHCQRSEYDAVIVNWKQSQFTSFAERGAYVLEALRNCPHPTALLISAAQAAYVPESAVLDRFDVVYKREPFRDRGRYDIRDQNRAKLVATMIHCPFHFSPKPTVSGWLVSLRKNSVPTCGSGDEPYDVGFSGYDAAEHSLRRDVWQAVVDSSYTRIGGLQTNAKAVTPLPSALCGPRLSGAAYKNALCQTKVNVALDGIGEYTFRHQEILSLGKFMVSSPSITDLELPMPLQAGEHYVTFTTPADAIEVIAHYLEHPSERAAIAAAGKKVFDTYYNPVRHGTELLAAFNT